MSLCFFVTDLHGNINRYEKLFERIGEEKPSAVFFGGDLMPSGLYAFTRADDIPENFAEDYLFKNLIELKDKLDKEYPRIFMILGNDDGRAIEPEFIHAAEMGIIEYIHNKKVSFNEFSVFGYSYVPPTPFMLKDWEKYDVSMYVDPGCIAPEDGSFSIEIDKKALKYQTIQKDLVKLCKDEDLSKSIFLFHTPPYNTNLDYAGLDNKFIEHVPLDVHVGSIAVERFIKERQPLLTLHGHVHESTSITGIWKEKIGNTLAMNAAHNGPELSLIRFDPDDLENSFLEIL